MQSISNIGATPVYTSPQGAASPVQSGQSGSSFQAAALVPPSSSLMAQGLSAGISRSLGAQMISTLLQTQDLSQTPQAHGHGGGGHHSLMKTMASLEAEEATGSEEAQLLKRRKKLADKFQSSVISDTIELDENGIPITNEDKKESEGDQQLGSRK